MSIGRFSADHLDVVMRALSDPTRREILVMVRDDEWAAGAIARRFPSISRPAVSQHLRVLEDAALVTARADGNRRLYRAQPESLDAAWGFITTMWQGSLQRLKVAAERRERGARNAKEAP